MARYAIRLDPIWRVPLLIIGATPSRSYVEVSDQTIGVNFGVCHEQVSLSEVADAERRPWPLILGIGVRLGPDGVAYVGSRKDVVLIKLRSGHPFRVLFSLKMKFSGF